MTSGHLSAKTELSASALWSLLLTQCTTHAPRVWVRVCVCGCARAHALRAHLRACINVVWQHLKHKQRNSLRSHPRIIVGTP